MKSLKALAQAVYDLFTGKTERQAAELREEFRKLCEKMEADTVVINDLTALGKFKTLKAAEYFNGRAAREPEQAAEYQRLAKLAATVDTDRMRGIVTAYKEGEEDVKEWHLFRDRYRNEINQYAGTKIDEFIAQDPARWERIKKHSPDMTAKPKP